MGSPFNSVLDIIIIKTLVFIGLLLYIWRTFVKIANVLILFSYNRGEV